MQHRAWLPCPGRRSKPAQQTPADRPGTHDGGRAGKHPPGPRRGCLPATAGEGPPGRHLAQAQETPKLTGPDRRGLGCGRARHGAAAIRISHVVLPGPRAEAAPGHEPLRPASRVPPVVDRRPGRWGKPPPPSRPDRDATGHRRARRQRGGAGQPRQQETRADPSEHAPAERPPSRGQSPGALGRGRWGAAGAAHEATAGMLFRRSPSGPARRRPAPRAAPAAEPLGGPLNCRDDPAGSGGRGGRWPRRALLHPRPSASRRAAGGHPARPGLRLLARKGTPRPWHPSEASLRTRRPCRTAPLPGVPHPPPSAVVFPGTAGRFVRMPRRPARLAAARAASVEGRIREGPHPSGRPVRRVPRGQPRSGRSRLPGRPRHGERRRRRSLCPCRRGTQSGTAPGGGPPCPVLRTSSGRFPPPAAPANPWRLRPATPRAGREEGGRDRGAPANPWRLRPATPPGRAPVACRPSRGSSGTCLPAGPAPAPAARPCLPCRHSGQDIRPQRCICPEPSGQPARGLPRECPGSFCRGRAPPPAGAARRPSRAAAEGVAGQASPSVSISAAASASGPVFPPHRTNWKTG